MKKIVKSAISLFIASAMILGTLFLNVNEIVIDSFLSVKADAAYTGTCGDNLTWTLDENGVMTISGTGAMDEYGDYYDSETQIPWCEYRDSIKSLVIEEGVTSVGESAFSYCTALESVTVPKTLTSFGWDAFLESNNIRKVYISDLTAWCSIAFGCGAGIGCGNPLHSGADLYLNGKLLTNLAIPDDVKNYMSFTFYGCTSIESAIIPEGVKQIGSSLFQGCKNLSYVKIPSTVTYIGDMAFWSCKKLNTIFIPKSVTDADCAFDNLNSIVYEGTEDEWNSLYTYDWVYDVEYFGSECEVFFNGQSDPAAQLTYTLNEDGKSYSVSGCSKSFSGDIKIWSNYNGFPVTGIADNAFEGCQNLNSVKISSNIKTIGDNAFKNCTALVSVNMSNSVVSVGDSAFLGCTGLDSVYVKSLDKWCGIEFGSDTASNPLCYAKYLYINDELLSEVVIPDGVTVIEKGAFSCENITSITLPESVTEIDVYAFSGATNLTSVTIKGDVKSIGDYAFDGCSSLSDVYYYRELSDWDKIDIGTGNECLNNANIAHACTYGDKVVVQLPTCTQSAVAEATCLVCGEVGRFYVDTAEVVVDPGLYPESEHNYADNTYKSYSFSYEGAKSLILNFSSDTYVESSFDYIYIHDEYDNLYEMYTGDHLSGNSVTLDGSAFTIYLESDESGNAYGFSFDSIIAVMDYTPTYEHSYSDTIYTCEPTCWEDGYTYKKCEKCGEIQILDSIPTSGHAPGDWIIDYSPSCTVDGYMHMECAVCGEPLESDFISAEGHISSDWILDSEPTCTEAGSPYKICTVCGEFLDAGYIEPLGHSPSDWIIECLPTCTDPGVKYRKCTVCGEWLESESIYAEGHTPSDWILDSEPTCTEAGSPYKICTVCGELLDAGYIEPLGHTSSEWIIDCLPTCTEPGSKYRNCTVCGEIIETVTIFSDVHTPGDWIIDGLPTCTDPGGKHIECTVCGAWLETDVISAEGHTSSDWIIDCLPTCTDPGVKYIECTVCGEWLESESIYAEGHTSSSWIIDIEANCKETGSKHKECTVCGALLETRKIPVTESHEYSTEWTIDSVPTCTEDGSKSRHCDICGDKTDVTVIASEGHKFEGTVIEDKHPHTNSQICVVCEEKVTNVLTVPDCIECNFTISVVGSDYKLISYVGTQTDVQIPARYKEGGVIAINNGCFRNNKTITSVNIGYGVSSIGSIAFMNCSSLEKVIIPSSVTTIGTQAFYGFNGTIYCESGSAAHEYALKNNIKYILVSVMGTENTQIDYDNFTINTTIQNCDDILEIIGISDSAIAIPIASYVCGNIELFGTGTIVTVFDGDEYIGDFTLIVEGDTDGDSVCDVLDVANVERSVNGHSSLEGAYSIAADNNADDIVDINDFQAIVNTALN